MSEGDIEVEGDRSRRVRLRWLAAIIGIATAMWSAVEIVGVLATAGDLGTGWGPDGLQPTYPGWQLDVAAGACVLVTLLLAAHCLSAAARLRPIVPLRAPSRGLLVLIGIVVGGLITGPAAVVGLGYGLHQVSTHTSAAYAAAAAQRAELRRVLGDATHPPQLRNFGSPAPAGVAAPLLRPSDLGRDWYYAGRPRVAQTQPSSADSGAAWTARVVTDLVREHWTGSRWSIDQDLLERATSYPTREAARQAIHDTTHAGLACSGSPSTCSPARSYLISRGGGLTAWRETGFGRYGVRALILADATVISLVASAPQGGAAPTLSGDQILRAAIRRLVRARAALAG